MKTIERSLFPSLKKALQDQRVVVLTGMRRVGKTTALRWLLDQVPSNNKYFFDLERLDQRAVFQEENYEIVINYFRSLGLDISQPLTIAVDEIQYVPNLPSVVKYLYDHYSIKFLLSGSSSFYIKNYFSESLSGRKIIYEMFPLSFGEFLNFRGIPHHQLSGISDMKFDKHQFDRLDFFYEEFVKFGGLPNVVLEADPQVKLEILNDIFSSYINIDVQALADFRKIGELRKLLQVLAFRIGNKIDITKISQIVGISRPTLNEYLEFLEKTYLIYQLPAFTNPDKSTSLAKKLYFRDNGIAGILAHPGDGALFENAVFNQLRTYGNLTYLSKRNEYEIDFVLTTPDNSPIALEVKYHPVLSDQKKLIKIQQKNDFSQAWLVGRYPTPEFNHFLWGGLIF